MRGFFEVGVNVRVTVMKGFEISDNVSNVFVSGRCFAVVVVVVVTFICGYGLVAFKIFAPLVTVVVCVMYIRVDAVIVTVFVTAVTVKGEVVDVLSRDVSVWVRLIKIWEWEASDDLI